MRIPPKDGPRSPPAASGAEKASSLPGPRVHDTVAPTLDPRQFGAQVAAEWRRLAPPLPDGSRPAAWLQHVGAPLAKRAASTHPQAPSPRWHLLPSPRPGLAALPSGDVFVTSGRLLSSSGPEEARSALAGELAHLALGHAERRLVETAGPALVEAFRNGEARAAMELAQRFDADDRLRDYAPAEREAALALARRWLEAAPLAADENARFEAARRALAAPPGLSLSHALPLPPGRPVALLVGGLVALVVLARTCS
jgi:hypothetical protein